MPHSTLLGVASG